MRESNSKVTTNSVPMSSQRVIKPGIKRRRPPLACIQCYQRKLKCGREFPCCSRCVKTGNANRCTYRNKSANTSSLDGFSLDGHQGSGAGAMTMPLHTPVSLTETPERPPASSNWNGKTTHLKGEENITKFYGCSYPLNFYQQFTELRSYIIQVKTKNPAINAIRDEIYPLANDGYRISPLAHKAVTADTLRELIPKKPVADTLVQTYIDRFEVLHRVLDKSTFIAEYNRHWSNPLCTPTSFVVQLLLVTAAAAIFHPEIYIDAATQQTVYDHAIGWLGAADSWLNSPANQPPQSWDILAGHCLLLIAKRANYIQEASFWMYTGGLVRWAMAAGYHREASPAARISPYHREMRRRLWATIVELDLQAAVERGMPPNIGIEDFNAISPLNIDDNKLQEIQESGHNLPEGMPRDILTDTSFQVLLYSSLTVRLEICALVNGCREQDDFQRVLALGEKLEVELQNIPEWNNPRNSPRQQQTTMYVKRVLNIHLYQYILLLYFQFAVQASPSFKSKICRRARLEASLKVLDHYQKLIVDEKVPEQACRTGLVLAALNVCHEIYNEIGPLITVAVFPQVSPFLIATAEKGLYILEKRVNVTLQGLNEYYILSMILGLVKSRLWPESRVTSDQEAADRVIRVCTMLQMRQAVIQPDYFLPGSVSSPRRLDFQEKASSMLSNGTTDLLNSIFSEDFEFINDSNGYTFL
ncbi:conserved hypothetical protein [Talaromyces stipitatus ATCC 10500]|uniref:Zn(2)-C6 fungal-type domain-containing protein n=1 Tax=Talaromyces stipitatus (strain ATCC 10500 / CBS 375.48 / QM 6759 / NRRL 1006) TaxID=441959 RepID=B8MMR6_TALSN|nr:uncharacterized protein TSTA_100660 [Talaromyces stipitatus ATCC 10500]EED13822.1 conserved hypothetical protein [Talaromyces stipitatus ATCC 10500]